MPRRIARAVDLIFADFGKLEAKTAQDVTPIVDLGVFLSRDPCI